VPSLLYVSPLVWLFVFKYFRLYDLRPPRRRFDFVNSYHFTSTWGLLIIELMLTSLTEMSQDPEIQFAAQTMASNVRVTCPPLWTQMTMISWISVRHRSVYITRVSLPSPDLCLSGFCHDTFVRLCLDIWRRGEATVWRDVHRPNYSWTRSSSYGGKNWALQALSHCQIMLNLHAFPGKHTLFTCMIFCVRSSSG